MSEQQVQITDLDPAQLQEVKKQLDEELDHLTTSFGQLKQAQTKFKACVSDISDLKPSSTGAVSLGPKFDVLADRLNILGKEVLVPLTSSLYVPGKLGDVSHVIVDVGTGYYVRKTQAEASAHYNAKSAFVQTNLDTLQKTIERKQENVQSVVQVLQMKLQSQTQGQAQ